MDQPGFGSDDSCLYLCGESDWRAVVLANDKCHHRRLSEGCLCWHQGGNTDDHRVTLYKWARFCWWPGNRWHWFWPWGWGNVPWSGWLKPIVRSGVYRRGRTVFLANKSNQPSAEGVVGKAFFSRTVVELKDLPDIQEPDPQARENRIDDYARRYVRIT